MALLVEAMKPQDWPRIREIYREGISTGDATFETEPPSWDAFDASHRSDCRIVARDRGRLVGWATLSPASDRCAYTGVAEVSVYVARGAQGRGVGRRLMARLVEESEAVGVWTLQAGIFPENRASLGLHEAFGFRTVGVRERLGRLDGRWRDVVMLERRSRATGIG